MKRILTLFVSNVILFSYMSIPAYAASELMMRTVTSDLVKGAFGDESVVDDEIDLTAPEDPDSTTEIIDEYSAVDEPIDT